tara:strand:- start:470 stop:571 length:102 start_codon:yes stop_codon:yes gene_type:complete
MNIHIFDRRAGRAFSEIIVTRDQTAPLLIDKDE